MKEGIKIICFNDSLSQMMKNAFYFILKDLSGFKIFKFLSWLYAHVKKRLDQKDKDNSETGDVTPWLANNYDTRIAQYLPN